MKMNRCDWINAYTKLTNKLGKRSHLTTEEIDELITLVEQLKAYIDYLGFEVMKRQ